MKKRLILLSFLAALGINSSAWAINPSSILDVYGDGKSEIILIKKNDTTYTWRTVAADGSVRTFNFGKDGDTLLVGKYHFGGKSEPALVHTESNNELMWKYLLPSGARRISKWGLKGDAPVSGDLDCDGKADLIVTRQEGENLRWYIKYRLRSRGTQEFTLGSKTAKAFAADVDGDGCDEAVVADLVSGEYVWTWRNSSYRTQFSKNWGVEGDTILQPGDIDNNGRADFIIVRNENNAKKFYVYLNGRASGQNSYTYSMGEKNDIPYVGSFQDRRYSQLAVYRRSTGVLYSAKRNQTPVAIQGPTDAGMIIGADGIFIDAPLVEENECTGNIVPITEIPGGGVLYKPVNVHGARGPTLIVQNRSQQTYISRLEIRNMNCEVIAYTGLFSSVGHYGSRYYMKSGGTGEDAEELLALAQTAGSNSILFKGIDGTWILVSNPLYREGSVR
ncbi:MAG: VCBS repeat-containing protein [Deltaproteobacteria bacterium]|nr:VCBS repeat-containing protein [Deltaproteobacteria bacterium]